MRGEAAGESGDADHQYQQQPSVRIDLLGGLTVWHGDAPLPLDGQRRLCLFAVLLLNHGRTVSTDELAAWAWPDDEAVTTLLVRALTGAGHSTEAAALAALDDLPRAAQTYQDAFSLAREVRQPDDEALALEGLGECGVSTGCIEGGITHLRQALEILRRLGMRAHIERVETRLADLTAGR